MDDAPYPDVYFAREDDSDDSLFYAAPRKVVHIDDAAIMALREVFARDLPEGGAVLDLMSSWRSHLPTAAYARVAGVGMNADEMADNPQLTDFIVADLNREPALPYPDATFDAAICTVSVQYLVRPVEVFAEVRRVMKPGGAFIVSFSNRCFPAKAVWVWRFTDDEKHLALVEDYFRRAGFVRVSADRRVPAASDPLYIVTGRAPKR